MDISWIFHADLMRFFWKPIAWDVFLLVLNVGNGGMIHWLTLNFIIPATPNNPSIPY